MKMIKTTILSVCLVCAASAANAQSTPTSRATKVSPATNSTVVSDVKVDQEYALPTDKLTKGIKSGVIPKDFPKYDQKMDKKGNKKVGVAYLVQHKDFLTEDAIAWLKEKNYI
jgi:hypothetical protein